MNPPTPNFSKHTHQKKSNQIDFNIPGKLWDINPIKLKIKTRNREAEDNSRKFAQSNYGIFAERGT